MANLFIVETFQIVARLVRAVLLKFDPRPEKPWNLVTYDHHNNPRQVCPTISIVIPTRDKAHLLKSCIESIRNQTNYPNYCIVVVDNQSAEPATLAYLRELAADNIRILSYDAQFNFSKICNFAAERTETEYLCFVNNDTQIIQPDWLELLLDHAIHEEVGIVGPQLLYPDGSIQHLGVMLGLRGLAGHVFRGKSPINADNSLGKDICFQVEAVTFACVMVKRQIFNSTNGLDSRFAVGLNDVDFCIRLRARNLSSIVCRRSTLIHHESQSRRSPYSLLGGVKALRENILFLKKWPNNLDDRFFRK